MAQPRDNGTAGCSGTPPTTGAPCTSIRAAPVRGPVPQPRWSPRSVYGSARCSGSHPAPEVIFHCPQCATSQIQPAASLPRLCSPVPTLTFVARSRTFARNGMWDSQSRPVGDAYAPALQSPARLPPSAIRLDGAEKSLLRFVTARTALASKYSRRKLQTSREA
jgi:hypothetical protein